MHGQTHRLDDLDAGGDLQWSIDFRRIYATLLRDWLDLPDQESLGRSFEPLPLLALGNR